MPDPRRERGRAPKTTGGSGRDDETPDEAVAMPQGDGDPRERDEERTPADERPVRPAR